MKMHIDFTLLVGCLQISIKSDPSGWHTNGYKVSELASIYLPTIMVTRKLAYGWFSIAWITNTKPNPDYTG
jgi:hypothetical protein